MPVALYRGGVWSRFCLWTRLLTPPEPLQLNEMRSRRGDSATPLEGPARWLSFETSSFLIRAEGCGSRDSAGIVRPKNGRMQHRESVDLMAQAKRLSLAAMRWESGCLTANFGEGFSRNRGKGKDGLAIADSEYN